jgi:uncharacterized SAM-binding protein YcdF (DUF218 family)
MTYFLSKFLPLFVYPAGLTCLVLLAAWIFWKKKTLARWLVLAAFLIIFLGGNRWVSMALVRSLEERYLPQKVYPKADVIVVLGGGTDAPQYPRSMAEVNGAGDRVIYGLKLYKDGVADQLILTGGTVDWQGAYATSPAEDMASLLSLMGVPKEKMILESKSANTAEDAKYSAEIIRDHGWKNVILVTSALHMPRSVKLFTLEGIDVIPAPVDYTITNQEWNELMQPTLENILINLLPTSGNLKSTTSSMKEYIGMVVNQITGSGD